MQWLRQAPEPVTCRIQSARATSRIAALQQCRSGFPRACELALESYVSSVALAGRRRRPRSRTGGIRPRELHSRQNCQIAPIARPITQKQRSRSKECEIADARARTEKG